MRSLMLHSLVLHSLVLTLVMLAALMLAAVGGALWGHWVRFSEHKVLQNLLGDLLLRWTKLFGWARRSR
jgi:hypothetical protein